MHVIRNNSFYYRLEYKFYTFEFKVLYFIMSQDIYKLLIRAYTISLSLLLMVIICSKYEGLQIYPNDNFTHDFTKKYRVQIPSKHIYILSIILMRL